MTYDLRKHEVDILEREADCAAANGFFYGALVLYGRAFSIFVSYNYCVRIAKKQMKAMQDFINERELKDVRPT